MWQVLVANLAVVALFISGWEYAHRRLQGRPRVLRNGVFGLLMGAGAMASMLLAIEVEKGFFFDLRSSLVAISGFFGGPLAVVITAAIAMVYRADLGGNGMWGGLVSIVITALVGVAGHAVLRGRRQTRPAVLVFSLAVALASIATMFILPHSAQQHTVPNLGLASLLLNFVSTLACGLVILQIRQRSDERDLLFAAMAQAPEFLYVKDKQSRFVAVNRTVASFHGFPSPRAMRGKSDFDLNRPERAQELFDAEQLLIAAGTSVSDFEEQLADSEGTLRWFSTSKSALKNPDGEIIGIAGVTRDITDAKRLEQELIASRNLLSHALGEMSDGLALFDHDGYLVFSNEQYRNAFPLTAELRVPGTHLSTILRASIDRGEQLGIPPEGVDAWIEEVVASLHKGSVQEIELYNNHWLRVRTRPTSDGDATVVTYDISDSRRSRQALLQLNDELTRLAAVDGLTGLNNRRTFDHTLATELARTERDERPLALLIADVDRFKAYNDIYGHPAGDEVLRVVGQCLNQTMRRAGDSVARYGGEEFVAILAGTDEDNAYLAAEKFRLALRELAVPHSGGDAGIVTISVGIAHYDALDRRRQPAELIRRADQALYDAKAAGRDRVMGWRPRHAVRQA